MTWQRAGYVLCIVYAGFGAFVFLFTLINGPAGGRLTGLPLFLVCLIIAEIGRRRVRRGHGKFVAVALTGIPVVAVASALLR